ncbi:hypothetical protein J6590_052093 [Homalodisca vitripennis]|nr:hypothetical protein J6590_052093 [Homalodisca vitripennis]
MRVASAVLATHVKAPFAPEGRPLWDIRPPEPTWTLDTVRRLSHTLSIAYTTATAPCPPPRLRPSREKPLSHSLPGSARGLWEPSGGV